MGHERLNDSFLCLLAQFSFWSNADDLPVQVLHQIDPPLLLLHPLAQFKFHFQLDLVGGLAAEEVKLLCLGLLLLWLA